MIIKLLHNTPLWVASKAIRKCWASEDKSDSCWDKSNYLEVEAGPKDKELIDRVGNKNKHKSTLEHLVYTFDIDGISRACLQEIARHRMASYSVKSTRYTLKELKNGDTTAEGLLVPTGNKEIDAQAIDQLRAVYVALNRGFSNDKVKYLLPEAYKTSLVMTINARSLQNFLSLRTDKSALWEIQNLARAMYDVLPEEHKYLFQEFIKKDNKCHTK